MSDVGISQQQSRRRARTEYLYLAVAVVGGTATIVLFLVDHTPTAAVDMPSGLYALLMGMCGVGAVGWIVRSGDAGRRGDLERARVELEAMRGQVAELTTAMQALTDRAGRVSCLSPRRPGRRYLGAAAVAAVAAGDTAPPAPFRTGLDPEAIQAARTIARRLIDGDTTPGLSVVRPD